MRHWSPSSFGLAACVALLTGTFAAGCSRPEPAATPTESPTAGPGVASATRERHTVIAFLGDSLTAGLGLLSTQSYPSLIETMFHNEGYGEVEVLNAGISGDTTAGGVRRLPDLNDPNIRILVVALGGNDALRGLSTQQTRENLVTIIDTALAANVRVLLAGMEGPTNLGDDYRAAFRGIFASLSRDYRGRIGYMPFLLEGVAGDPRLNQPDGIHPTAEGAKVIADHLYPQLRDMVDQLPTTGGGPQ